jgi:hypothetical protein
MPNPDRQQQTKVAPTLHRLSMTYRTTGSIKPDPRNARTHSKGQVTRRGELVRDSFLVSATTLTASERCGRRFRGLNIDPAYVDVAIDRWIAMTGGTPELAQRRKA